ncbi:TonB-dependent receptor [Maricaulis sp.]|uniref:TonB-dependent receptor n=1 Tax=Maricaulis sp. TaxID=1486257 RepID=UPI001B112A79|nr:TonB-dependent receptor [Maricaulis sp.]MBO6798088.1 TonB-dependent receptor [Maricaulis sp.]
MKTTKLAQKSLLWAGASVAALTLAATPSFAQDNGAATLDVITVTTNRREENIQDVANSVTAQSGEDLAPYTEGGADILTLAARIPSVYAESSNGRVAPRFYIRGLGNTDFDLAASQPVSIIMDDIVQENVILKSFPLFDVQQVEIARGPQGTLFGRNTTAGTIKFDSVRPSQETDGFMSLTLGSLGTVNLESAIGGALIEDVLSARISLLSQNRDDWIDNAFTGENDAMGGHNEWAGRAQLLYTPNDSFDALFNVHARSLTGTAAIFRANILTPGSNDLNANFDRGEVYYDSTFNNPQNYDSWGTSANMNFYLDGGMTFTSITGYENAEGRSLGDIDGGNLVNGPGFIPFPSETQDGLDDLDQFTQEFRLASSDELDTTWQIGAYYFDGAFDITTLGPNGGFPPPTTVRHENELWAVFGQVSHQVNERLNLSGGVRYTSDEKSLEVIQAVWPAGGPYSASDEEVSWDLSAYYDYSDETAFFARVARGFRGPSIQGRDVAFFGTPSIADSETSISYEAGIKSEPMGGRARINATAFYYTVSDLQLSAVGGGGNLVQLVNADEGVGYGFEVDSEFLVSENLLITAGFSWNETELQDDTLEVGVCAQCTVTDPDADNDGFAEVDGNPFPQAPDYIVSLTARYSIPADNGGEWFVYTDWFYQGRTNLFLYESEEFYSEGNFEGGLRVGYAGSLPNGRAFEAAVFSRNITGEENLVGGIDFNNNTGFVNEPSVWGVSFRADFN